MIKHLIDKTKESLVIITIKHFSIFNEIFAKFSNYCMLFSQVHNHNIVSLTQPHYSKYNIHVEEYRLIISINDDVIFNLRSDENRLTIKKNEFKIVNQTCIIMS
jgi:hypothetical protein